MFPPMARRFGHVLNVHSVHLHVPVARAGALLDTLGSDADALWPVEHWPPMRITGPLCVGVEGRHGPVRYAVEEYVPATRVRFRFREPAGFVGTHTFSVCAEGDGCRLEHRVEIAPRGLARVAWPLVFGPLHDALAEDAIARAVRALGGTSAPRPWSAWVRALRVLAGVVDRRARRSGERPARAP